MRDENPSHPDEQPWYYVEHDARRGPVSTEDITTLITAGEVQASTLVWRKGLHAWTPAAAAGFAFATVRDGTPLSENLPVSNVAVWVVAFLPLLSMALTYITGMSAAETVIVGVGINSVLCFVDERRLKQAGYNTQKLGYWWLILIPVYLWKRATLMRDGRPYFWTWLAVMVLTVTVR